MQLNHVATGFVGTGCIPLLLLESCQVSLGPVVLVTSKMVGNTLSICRYRTHDPRLCTDCPPYASMCTLGLSSWPSHSWPNSC